MLVCLCFAVSDAAVRGAVAEGAADVAEVGRRLGAGTDCGGCRERLAALIEAAKAQT